MMAQVLPQLHLVQLSSVGTQEGGHRLQSKGATGQDRMKLGAVEAVFLH